MLEIYLGRGGKYVEDHHKGQKRERACCAGEGKPEHDRARAQRLASEVLCEAEESEPVACSLDRLCTQWQTANRSKG